MRPDPMLYTGDRVHLSFRGRLVTAVVLLASTNSRSAMLGFEAILDGYVGMMPILWDDARRTFTDLITSEPVVVTHEIHPRI